MFHRGESVKKTANFDILEFFHQFCSLFPHHLIKTTRLRKIMNNELNMSYLKGIRLVISRNEQTWSDPGIN